MAGIGDIFRARADELREASKTFLDAPDLSTDVKKQISVIVAQVAGHQYEGLAELADFWAGANGIDKVVSIRRKFAEQNDAIRKAAAAGNWTEFDRLVAGRIEPENVGSAPNT